MPKYTLVCNGQIFSHKTPKQISKLISARIKTMEKGQSFQIIESGLSPNTYHFTNHNDGMIKFSVLHQWYNTDLKTAKLLAFTTFTQAHFYAMSPTTLDIVSAILAPVINLLEQ